MKNKEYLIKLLDGLGVSENDVDIILLKAEIDGNADVQVALCDKAVYDRMSVVLKGALKNVTEGGYSVSWNMDAVKLFYNALCNELGLENVLEKKPQVRNRSNYW